MKSGETHKTNMSGKDLDALCKHCGQALTDFLQEMEKHNAQVVCPSCGKTQAETGKGAVNRTTHDHSHHANPADGNSRKRNQPVSSGKR